MYRNGATIGITTIIILSLLLPTLPDRKPVLIAWYVEEGIKTIRAGAVRLPVGLAIFPSIIPLPVFAWYSLWNESE
jgi:hypothetical protein